ncbi:YIP1 family protein [Candidatus Woesearchaeota archaeon]|nr:YIP1 family protein [Candidatus Woesearchaeota archaeon]
MANNNATLNLWQKIKTVIIRPKDFFDAIQSETDIKTCIIFFLIIELIALPLNIVAISLTGPLNIIIYILSFIIGIVAFFIMLWIYNLIISWLGGKQGIIRTFQAIIYGLTPVILLSWLPFVNIIATLYSVYLTIIGISKLQQITIKKAAWAYFLPLIIIMLVAIIWNIIS